MIRILQIVKQMNVGGMESRLMDLYRVIDRNYIQFDFYTCCPDKGAFDDEIKELGGEIYYNSPLEVKKLFKIPHRFEVFLKKHPEYKIVHCHLNQWCGWILYGAKSLNVPVRIAHSRTALNNRGIKNIVKNIIKIPVNLSATHKFAVSKEAAIWLFGKRTVKKGNVNIFPNSIDCEKFLFNPQVRKIKRRELNLGNAFTLINVGNIRPEKNHIFLLKIFSELQKKYENSKLIIVGKDNMNGKIQQEAKKLKIENNILFLGSRSDVPELLQAGDIFVFPSLYEGFPGAVLEAEASGLPCILSDTITDQVCLCKNVKSLSLKKSAKIWSETILMFKDCNDNRKKLQENYKLVDEGYDIHSLSEKMTKFYLDASK